MSKYGRIRMICSTRFTRYVFTGLVMLEMEWNFECGLLSSRRSASRHDFFHFQFQFRVIGRKWTFMQN